VRGTHGVHACAHARAADYVPGAVNTNACPAGYVKIPTAAMCQAAAAALSKPYGGAVPHTQRPGGCFLDTGNPNQVYFNTNAAGTAFANAQPLCRFGAPRVRLCVYSFRVLTVCSIYVLAVCARGDAFSTDAVTARPSRRRWFGTCVQPRTRRTLPTPTPARRGTPRSPTKRRVTPRRRSSGRRTITISLYVHQINRAGASSASKIVNLYPLVQGSTSTTTRPAPLPLTHSRCADSVRRSKSPPPTHLRGTPWGRVPRGVVPR
jgi:hypothetical protein